MLHHPKKVLRWPEYERADSMELAAKKRGFRQRKNLLVNLGDVFSPAWSCFLKVLQPSKSSLSGFLCRNIWAYGKITDTQIAPTSGKKTLRTPKFQSCALLHFTKLGSRDPLRPWWMGRVGIWSLNPSPWWEYAETESWTNIHGWADFRAKEMYFESCLHY